MSSKINNKPVEITELVLRDAHQSLFATRMRIDDMLPIAEKLDDVGHFHRSGTRNVLGIASRQFSQESFVKNERLHQELSKFLENKP